MVAVRDDGQVLAGEEARDFVRQGSAPIREGVNVFTSTKNDIGTKKTYPKAPPGLQTPKDVAEHILRFLLDGIADEFPASKIDQVVVTVPASFQLDQRDDTIRAALDAGLDIAPSQLFDEPVAAYLAHIALSPSLQSEERCVVVDFGGGTCDVALLSAGQSGDRLAVNLAGTSRYCRLGGDDIDRAIVVEHLLPILAAANGKVAAEWSYVDLAAVIIPALQPTAEELKIKINDAIVARRRIGRPYQDVKARASRDLEFTLGGQTLRLPGASVELTAGQFENLLTPFVDPESIRPAQGEYYESTSIHAPLREVLERRGWEFDDGERLLVAGGSSQLVPVLDSLQDAFGVEPEFVASAGTVDLQAEISLGAALQAFSLALDPEGPLVRARTDEPLVVNVAGGAQEVVPGGVDVPWPAHPMGAKTVLRIGEGSNQRGLRLEFARAGVTIWSETIPLPPGVEDGDTMTLAAWVDANQTVHLERKFADGGSHTIRLERPWTFVDNPGNDRAEILQLEAEYQQNDTTAQRKYEIRLVLMSLYRKIGHYGKAVESSRYALRHASSTVLEARATHSLAMALWSRGARDEALSVLRSGVEKGAEGLRFSLAYRLHERGDQDAALHEINQCVLHDADGPNLALQGKVLKAMGRRAEAADAWEKATNEFGHPLAMNAFERSWMEYVAKQRGDRDVLHLLAEARRSDAGDGHHEGGVLPDAVDVA